MTTTTARLVLLLRICYILGAALFVLDVVYAFAAQGFEILLTGDIAEHSPADSVIEWIAVIAFALVALGAVLTIAATTEFTKNGIDSDLT
ncbi:hypothetical protein [Herbiconiux sp.]|uniref:hypothetical protein n=1 Tax=Herbiconiux sp. TaxID=1871186 RepID=UPI0025C3B8F3|nr:hypothetical protein [Herbiconiux sp.]